MLFGPNVFLNAGLLLFGLIWCHEMFGRLGSDLAELRSARERLDQAPILILWALTVLIAVNTCGSAWSITQKLLRWLA